jgi:hypothetical protein
MDLHRSQAMGHAQEFQPQVALSTVNAQPIVRPDNSFSSLLSVLLTFEISAACDEFPATCREGVPVAPRHRKESSADTVRRCTQNTLMFLCGSKTIDYAFNIEGHALPVRVTGGAAAQSPSACSACIALLHLRKSSYFAMLK